MHNAAPLTRIRAERLRRGWSQQTLAFHAAVTVADLSRIETGRLRSYNGQAQRLAQVLDVSPAELLSEVPASQVSKSK